MQSVSDYTQTVKRNVRHGRANACWEGSREVNEPDTKRGVLGVFQYVSTASREGIARTCLQT